MKIAIAVAVLILSLAVFSHSQAVSVRQAWQVQAQFEKVHPCPVPKGKTSGGECPGFKITFRVPLACGGKDVVSNLQWEPVKHKDATSNMTTKCGDKK
jgi:hypothetical protein